MICWKPLYTNLGYERFIKHYFCVKSGLKMFKGKFVIVSLDLDMLFLKLKAVVQVCLNKRASLGICTLRLACGFLCLWCFTGQALIT